MKCNVLAYAVIGWAVFVGQEIYSQQVLDYGVEAMTIVGNGEFTPYYFVSNKQGIVSAKSNTGYFRGNVDYENNLGNNWNIKAGLDMYASYNSYNIVDLQQIYGLISYKSLMLEAGMREHDGAMKNQALSSGGLTWSGNSRPIPQLRIAIPDFVEIPLTNGWLQVTGLLSYGKFVDNKWLEDNYSYQESYITTDVWFHQKQFFLRSKEDKNFVFTIGAEIACQFGGNISYWENGKEVLERRQESKLSFKDFFNVLIPREGAGEEEVYYTGNHVGSWHLIGEYKLNKSVIKAYTEWLFEDGSGMGKLNGWDGLWGLEFKTGTKSIVNEVVLEYLQTTNQSGPMHYAPNDFAGVDINSQATGADDYYNNYYYNGWSNYGMGLGSPMLKSVIYNNNGYLKYLDTRIKSYHIAMSGFFSKELGYKLMMSHRDSWGTYFIPSRAIRSNTSAYIELNYNPKRFSGWSGILSLGMDRGELYGDNYAAGLSIKKTGKIF